MYQSQSTIRNVNDSDKPELGWVVDEQAASRGLEAWQIAVDLRKVYGIAAIELEWDYPDYLRTVLDRAAKQRREYRQRNVA